MSNYADRTAVRTGDLGPCRCPVSPPPHERDSGVFLIRFGYGQKAQIRQASRLQGVEQGYMMMALLGTVSWTLVLPDGTPRPVDAEQIELLDDATLLGVEKRTGKKTEVTIPGILTHLAEAMSDDPLPNASSGPSPAGTPGKGGPIPTTPTPPSSTSA